jgi:hypothetical protein
MNKYLSKNPTIGTPDSYDLYKHKNGLSTLKSYTDAVNSLYASSKKNLSSYGANNRQISNKGLQNSGYATYIDDLAKNSFTSGLNSINAERSKSENAARSSYASYLEKYQDKQNKLKDDVMSHLIDNDIVDINTAIAYGVTAGLSKEDATLVGQSAYEVTKQKVLNKILEQTVSLGLDTEGAKMLAIKMGVSESDAEEIAKEVGEMLDYYRNLSDDYLEFLENRSK